MKKNFLTINKRFLKTLIKKELFYNSFLKRFKLFPSAKKIKKKLNIKVTSNNIFCTYSDFLNNKIIYNGSSGLYNIKVSKKKIKIAYKSVLYKFFGSLKKVFKKNFLNKILITITAPIKLRKKIIRSVIQKFKKKKYYFLKIKKKKCFNGCRASKVRRKKNLKFKIYK
jgi:ribosomal protein S11